LQSTDQSDDEVVVLHSARVSPLKHQIQQYKPDVCTSWAAREQGRPGLKINSVTQAGPTNQLAEPAELIQGYI